MDHIYSCNGHVLKLPDIVRGQGIYLYDRDGKRYVDMESGEWCTSVGHSNERITATITHQADLLMHVGFCYSSRIVEEAAEEILGILGWEDGQCVFLGSGSEANEFARQVSRHLTGKSLSMTLKDSYLGSFSSTIDRSRGWFLYDWRSCDGCRNEENCDRFCELLRDIPDEVSDFTLEAGSSSGAVHFPPTAMINRVAGIVHDNGGKIIANEVTVGVGRTGKWFGYQHYGIEPDLIAMGKGIGNGYPVSVVAINGQTVRELEHKPFHYSQSHQNDPLGAAVAREVVRIIKEEDLIAKARQKGDVFLSQLESLVDHRLVMAARGRGLMCVVDLANRDITERLHDLLLERGFIVGNRHTAFRIDPPLTVEPEVLESFIAAFRDCLALV